MNSFPQTPSHVNGQPITPEQHDRFYGGAAVEYDENGLLVFVGETLPKQRYSSYSWENQPGYDESRRPYAY